MKMKPNIKGAKYERNIVKSLSLWYTNGKRDDIFYRTSGSGARATKRINNNIDTANSCGDISALDSIGQKLIDLCIFELKSGYTKQYASQSIQIIELIDTRNKKDPLIVKWIKKIQKESKQHKRKHAIIIFRRDRKNSCILIFKNTWNILTKNNNYSTNNINMAIVHYGKDIFAIMKLYDFFNWCDPKAFYQKVKRKKHRKIIKYPEPL